MNYYYFAASLPALSPDAPPPFTAAAVLEACRQHLSAADAAEAARLLAGPGEPGISPFGRAWHDRETLLRNAVARIRAARLKTDAAPHLRPAAGYDAAAERAAADAFARPTPSEREKALDRFRWRTLDELAAGGLFSSAAVLAYGLRLRIVERWASLDKARGRAAADAWVAEQSRGRGTEHTGIRAGGETL